MAAKKRTLDDLKADNADVAAASNEDKKQKTDCKSKNKDKSDSKDDEKVNLLELTMRDPYQVGSCINLIYETFYERMLHNKESTMDSHETLSDYVTKHNILMYFFSIVTNVCLADGKLASEEEAVIRSFCSKWSVSEKETIEALKGVDYTKEYLEACSKYWDALIPNLNKKDKDALINGMKNDIVLYSVLAASQDGFDKTEYKKAEEIAKKLGLSPDCVKENVEIVKLEAQLAQRVLGRLQPHNNKNGGAGAATTGGSGASKEKSNA